jgi:hypothetical protein
MGAWTGTSVARSAGFAGVWLAAFGISLASYGLLNDHFGRISPARQIAVYGELPFRDFLDPGYFMTEFTSAALQRLFGDNLLGEMLLNCAFVASGATLVAVLSMRVAHSFAAAVIAGLLAVLTLPRPYDFDKVLFYPLGVALCWRCADAQSASRIWTLALGVVVAALYRYDTGVFIAGAAIVAMAVVHAGDWKALGRSAGLLVAAVLCLSAPVMLFLQRTAGIRDTADQVLTYGLRESGATRITGPVRLSLANPIGVSALPPLPREVAVRWLASVDDTARRAVEHRHKLVAGAPRGTPDERTWAYQIDDTSPSNLRSLVGDAAVEDTSGIDRARFELTREPLWIRAQRAVPLLRVRVFPGAWHTENADAFLFHVLRILPLAAALILLLRVRSPGSVTRSEAAAVASLIALTVVLNVFILRHPIGGRVGGMAGPAVILAVWLVRNVRRLRHPLARRMLEAGTAAVMLVTVWSVSASAGWQHRLAPEVVRPASVVSLVERLSATPPDPGIMGGRSFVGLVDYLRECTSPADRILATWFAPELYFFAQRGFAAGVVAVAGHWTEPRFQRRSLQFLASHPALVVVHRTADTSFREQYPLLARHFDDNYTSAGTTDFADGQSEEGTFELLVLRDRVPRSTHSTTALPCF